MKGSDLSCCGEQAASKVVEQKSCKGRRGAGHSQGLRAALLSRALLRPCLLYVCLH